MKTFDPQTYAIAVKKVQNGAETLFQTTVRELPDLAEFADSFEEAYALAIDTLAGLHQLAQEQNRVFPAPLGELDDFSGRVTLRMPKSMHRQVSTVADAEGVSLNQFILSALAIRLGAILGIYTPSENSRVAEEETPFGKRR